MTRSTCWRRRWPGERQYSQAAIAYDDTYNRNRKGAHAPEALVGLAYSLTANQREARRVRHARQAARRVPAGAAEVREAAVAVEQRAGCK